MRTGLILSVAAHLLMWAFIAFAGPRALTGVPPQAIEVAIVSANDAPPVPQGDGSPPGSPKAPEPPLPPKAEIKLEAKPDLSVLAATPPVKPFEPSPSAAAQPPPLPQPQSQPLPLPEQSIPDPASLAEMLMLPAPQGSKSGFDGQAERSAKLTAADIAAFKAHVRTCARIPDAVASDRNLKIVVRVVLKPDGALASPPVLIAASPSQHGPALVAGAIAALKACQPYLELPPAKYKEWKVLDVTLRAQDLVGG